MAGAVLDYNSDLIRQQWITEGLIQAASKSLYAPLIGTSPKSVIYQVNDFNAKEGHTVVFDYDGNLVAKAVKGKDRARGTGERKKKFSDKIIIDRYRTVAYNEDEFDATAIGDLSLSWHAKSRSMLADNYIRWKDQAIIDTLFGLHNTPTQVDPTPTHRIELTSFDINDLTDIEQILKTGRGFTTGGIRRPPEPFYTQDGEPRWIIQVDTFLATKLKKSPQYQALVYNADVRGNQNRAFKGVIGKIGHLIIQEMPSFMGITTSDDEFWGLDEIAVEIAGFRQYDKDNGKWLGQKGFDFAANLRSRAIILGANAVQFGNGRMPNYKFAESDDFGIDSETMVEVWQEFQKTKLKAENDDYVMAKVGGYDYGVVVIDVDL